MASIWLNNRFKKIKEMANGIFKEDGVKQGEDDECLWFLDLEKYSYGKYSYACVQAIDVHEEYSQIIPGPEATFVGVYDGHNGHQASQFVSQNLYETLIRRLQNTSSTLREGVEGAFSETEKGFLDKTEEADIRYTINLSTVGSCCLVGVMRKREMILANLGDSKAVLGSYDISNTCIRATQLTHDHGVTSVSDRTVISHSHRRFPNTARLIKRIPNLQTTHAIGDGFMKDERYEAPRRSPFYIPKHLGAHYPVMSAVPNISSRNIRLLDRFLIFASSGFWEHFTNEEVVKMVHNKPKEGIARKLIVRAMERAAQKKGTTYNSVKQIPAGEGRRAIHEDMTVIVLFIDHLKFYKKPRQDLYSVEAFAGQRGLANFRF